VGGKDRRFLARGRFRSVKGSAILLRTRGYRVSVLFITAIVAAFLCGGAAVIIARLSR
jgi:hypothetical protein